MADEDAAADEAVAAKRAHPVRRRVLIAITAVILLLVGTTGFYIWNLNSKLDDIDRVPIGTITGRPEPDSGRDLNVLLLGSDNRASDDPEADVASRSDTLMVVHISGDRKAVSVVSIPRDSLVTVYDDTGAPQGKTKINAAFARWGVAGAVSTVEHLTDLRMDHVAIIEWAGFKDLATAVGGVPVTVPKAFYDPSQKKQWEARDYLLKGNEALLYVRTRYGLARGDFDRIERQQNFMRSLMREIIDSGKVTKPLEFNETLGAITRNLTVDEEWDNGEIRSLALSLRGTGTENVTFLTVPIAGTRTIEVHGSIVDLDQEPMVALFAALRDDTVQEWVHDHPDSLLPGEDEIG